jgi:hypothetical protein
MGTIVRGLALALTLIWPAIGNTVPILTTPPGNTTPTVTGWSNEFGNFAVTGTAGLIGFSVGSYSTAASLFSMSNGGTNIAYLDASGASLEGPADVRIDAIVQNNGTISGTLVAGILTIRAGAIGIPAAGIVPGQLLLVGNAIDSAAVNSFDSVDFLFKLTYTVPILSGLGDFATFYGPFPGVWGAGVPALPFLPWGKDWGPSLGGDFFDLDRTVRVLEPDTLALIAIALVGLGFARRYKQSC